MIVGSSAGIAGWRYLDPDHFLKVGKDVHIPGLCGIWLKQALSAVSDLPEWERIERKMLSRLALPRTSHDYIRVVLERFTKWPMGEKWSILGRSRLK